MRCCGTTFFLDILVLPMAPEPVLGTVWLRATLPVETPDLFLSRSDLPIRRFVMLSVPVAPTRPRLRLDFVGDETDGVLLAIMPPIREDLIDELPTLEVLPELAAGCLTPVGVEGPLMPIEPVPVEREILLELERLLERAAGRFATGETDGLPILIVLLEPEAGRSILIELPMRDLEPEEGRSILNDRLGDEDPAGVLVAMEPPIRNLGLVIDRLRDKDTDGALVLMEPPIRDLLLGLIRMLDLLVEPVELLLIDEPDEDLRKLEELEGLETVIRLDIEPLGLLLIDIVPERLGVDRLIDILLELLLRLGIEYLDEIEPERLGVDRLTDILLELPLRLGTERLGVGARLMDDLLELLRLGTDRLDVIVLDRLGVGARLIDDLLELLRLGVDRLTDILLELLRLDVGARFTDDLLELLRLGALALADGAGLATDVFALELRELELLRELLPAKTGSATRVSSKMKRINRKLKPINQILSL